MATPTRKPRAKKPGAPSVPITEQQKRAGRQLVYTRLKTAATASGESKIRVVHYDSVDELRTQLGLKGLITMGLLKSAIWHMNRGDYESTQRPVIEWRRPRDEDNFGKDDRRRFVIIP